MQLDSIFRTILWGTAAFAAGAFVSGWALGLRAKAKGSLIVTMAALVIAALLVGGTYPLARAHGEAITNRAWLMAGTLDAALLGGFAAGRKQRKGSGSGVATYVIATVVVIVLLLSNFAQQNAKIAQAASDLGLNKTAPAVAEAESDTCPDRLKHLYTALANYAQDWDALPPAVNWMDNEELATVKAHPEWLRCPAVSNGKDNRYGYAYNEKIAARKLNGKPLAQAPEAAKTPLLYDSSNLTRNAHDAFSSLPQPGRHNGKNNVLYCDGHVE